jgi:hypothetical protein
MRTPPRWLRHAIFIAIICAIIFDIDYFRRLLPLLFYSPLFSLLLIHWLMAISLDIFSFSIFFFDAISSFHLFH